MVDGEGAAFVDEVTNRLNEWDEMDARARKQASKALRSLAKSVGGGMGKVALEILDGIEAGRMSIKVDTEEPPSRLAETSARVQLLGAVEDVQNGQAPPPDSVYLILAPTLEHKEHSIMATSLLGGSQTREATCIGLASVWGLDEWAELKAVVLRSTDARLHVGSDGDGDAWFEGTIRTAYAWFDEDGKMQYRRLEREVSRAADGSVQVGPIDLETNVKEPTSELFRGMFQINQAMCPITFAGGGR